MPTGAINKQHPLTNHPMNNGLRHYYLACQDFPSFGGLMVRDLIRGRRPAADGTSTAGVAWSYGTGYGPVKFPAAKLTASGTTTSNIQSTCATLTDFTMAFNFRYTAAAFFGCFSPCWLGAGSKGFGFRPEDPASGNLNAQMLLGFTLHTGSALTTATDYYIVLTRTGSAAAIHTFGPLGITTTTFAGVDTETTGTDFTIFGAFDGASQALCSQSVGNLRIYDRGLSTQQATDLAYDAKLGHPLTLNRLPSRRVAYVAAAAATDPPFSPRIIKQAVNRAGTF